jgi:formylglycine-generating enzyme required for sulfatase activity
MRPRRWLVPLAAACALQAGATTELERRNEALIDAVRREHRLDAVQIERIREIIRRSGVIGQGNRAISQHTQTPAQCLTARAASPPLDDAAGFERICGAPHMAPLYDPGEQRAADAQACIDQYEFPDIPCEYPVVWVRAREAAQICTAMGKRLCDAHEWEGACEGRLQPPDYRFDLARGVSPGEAVRRMREVHNRMHEADKRWSYGLRYERGICGAGSQKTPGCVGGGWNACGSNTYPAGAFAHCRSALGVYDLHGNVAEHMNLPLEESQMASRGSATLGHTEMKGSWFIFDSYRAHEDWCRWRAPYWHGSRVLDANSHANYHLGFRCCKTLPAR